MHDEKIQIVINAVFNDFGHTNCHSST